MRTICNLSWDRSKSMVHIIDLYAFVTRSLIPCSILFDWLFQVMWLAWFFMTYFEWAGLNKMVQCISMILTIHVPKKILQHIHVSRPYILQMLILTPTSLPSMQTLHSANLNLLLAACCLLLDSCLLFIIIIFLSFAGCHYKMLPSFLLSMHSEESWDPPPQMSWLRHAIWPERRAGGQDLNPFLTTLFNLNLLVVFCSLLAVDYNTVIHMTPCFFYMLMLLNFPVYINLFIVANKKKVNKT